MVVGATAPLPHSAPGSGFELLGTARSSGTSRSGWGGSPAAQRAERPARQRSGQHGSAARADVAGGGTRVTRNDPIRGCARRPGRDGRGPKGPSGWRWRPTAAYGPRATTLYAEVRGACRGTAGAPSGWHPADGAAVVRQTVKSGGFDKYTPNPTQLSASMESTGGQNHPAPPPPDGPRRHDAADRGGWVCARLLGRHGPGAEEPLSGAGHTRPSRPATPGA